MLTIHEKPLDNYVKRPKMLSYSLYSDTDAAKLNESVTIFDNEPVKYYHELDGSAKARLRKAAIARKTNGLLDIRLRENLANVLSTIVCNSIPLDESFKIENEEKIKGYVKFYLKENLLQGDMQNQYRDLAKKSDFLHELTEACKKKSKAQTEACQKKLKEGDEEDDDDAFDFDDDADLIFEDEATDINEAQDIIKEKVTNVILSEKEKEKEKQEVIQNIIDNNKEKGLEESLIYNKKLPQYSLFKAININAYKNAIHDAVDLNESTQYVKKEGDRVKVNMDMILAEALITYTLYETLYTLKIKDYNSDNVRDLARELAYQKI